MNRNQYQKTIPFTIHLIPIPVPIPPKCAKMAKEPESGFLRNWIQNGLSTRAHAIQVATDEMSTSAETIPIPKEL